MSFTVLFTISIVSCAHENWLTSRLRQKSIWYGYSITPFRSAVDRLTQWDYTHKAYIVVVLLERQSHLKNKEEKYSFLFFITLTYKNWCSTISVFWNRTLVENDRNLIRKTPVECLKKKLIYNEITFFRFLLLWCKREFQNWCAFQDISSTYIFKNTMILKYFCRSYWTFDAKFEQDSWPK